MPGSGLPAPAPQPPTLQWALLPVAGAWRPRLRRVPRGSRARPDRADLVDAVHGARMPIRGHEPRTVCQPPRFLATRGATRAGGLADRCPGRRPGRAPGLPALVLHLSLIHISEPTRRTPISYAVFCLK